MTYCERDCDPMSVFDASCPCHEAAVRLSSTETNEQSRSRVSGTRERQKANEGDEMSDTQTTLYRCYNRQRAILYVGITSDLKRRLTTHKRSFWWHEVSLVDEEVFDSREEAEIAERAAIEDEAPRYNHVYNKGRGSKVSTSPRRPVQRNWYSISEAAEYLGTSTRTVRRRIADGTIPAYRQGPRLIRILAEDVEQLFKQIPTVGGVR